MGIVYTVKEGRLHKVAEYPTLAAAKNEARLMVEHGDYQTLEVYKPSGFMVARYEGR